MKEYFVGHCVLWFVCGIGIEGCVSRDVLGDLESG
jgi:hypothetical protein